MSSGNELLGNVPFDNVSTGNILFSDWADASTLDLVSLA